MNAKGGAIYIWGDNITIESCVFVNNTAYDGGAIHFFIQSPKVQESTTLVITNTVFVKNKGTREGGALEGYGYDRSGWGFLHVMISDSHFTNNTSRDGGAFRFSFYDDNDGDRYLGHIRADIVRTTFAANQDNVATTSRTNFTNCSFTDGDSKSGVNGNHVQFFPDRTIRRRQRRRTLQQFASSATLPTACQACVLCSPPEPPPPTTTKPETKPVFGKAPSVAYIGVSSTAGGAVLTQQAALGTGISGNLRNVVEMSLIDYLTFVPEWPEEYRNRAPRTVWAHQASQSQNATRCPVRWAITDAKAALHAIGNRAIILVIVHTAAVAIGLLARRALARPPPALHPERAACAVAAIMMPTAVHVGAAGVTSGDAATVVAGCVLLAYGLVPVAHAAAHVRRMAEAASSEEAYKTDVSLRAIITKPKTEKVMRVDGPRVIAWFLARKGYWTNDNAVVLAKGELLDIARTRRLWPVPVYIALKWMAYVLFGVFAVPCACDATSVACTLLQPSLLCGVIGAQALLLLLVRFFDSPFLLVGDVLHSLGWLVILASGFRWHSHEEMGSAIMAARAASGMYTMNTALMSFTMLSLIGTLAVVFLDTAPTTREAPSRVNGDVESWESYASTRQGRGRTRTLVTDRHESLDVLFERSSDHISRAVGDMGTSAPESNDNNSTLFQTMNPLYTPSNNAPAQTPPQDNGESEEATRPRAGDAEVPPPVSSPPSVEEHDNDNSSAGKHEDGAEPLDDEPEWAGLAAHEKARLRKERSFRYQLLKTRVRISEDNHFHRPSIHGDFASFERVLDGYRAEADTARGRS